jgi:hypothetical protein
LTLVDIPEWPLRSKSTNNQLLENISGKPLLPENTLNKETIIPQKGNLAHTSIQKQLCHV